ncbi:HNH endonuclease [Salinicoccus sp. HZC-1]|uniref:HNH endonuclease n=1 Tax=Salinicoccus sp. HZC-1 TaxID=3385497 RepID=UPI00398B12A6
MERKCMHCGSSIAVVGIRKGMPLCRKHYLEVRKYGKVRTFEEKYGCKIIETSDHYEVCFKNGDVGLIDKPDLELFKTTNWHVSQDKYIVGWKNGKIIKLHRLLMDFPDEFVDHRNRNPLDNRKQNLRLATPSDNARNSKIQRNNKSGVAGVRRVPNYNTWNARIIVNNKYIHLGNYKTFEEAVAARKEAESKYFGEFAPQ